MLDGAGKQQIPVIQVPIPVPMNLWAATTNRIFYKQIADPLRCFRTLGSADPLLPKAFATHLKNAGADAVHEIGSGNFFFARQILNTAPNIREYHTYDFSASSFQTHGSTLPSQIKFHHTPANQVRNMITKNGSQIVGVELCDDLPNEFWTSKDGVLYELYVDIGIDRRLDVPEHEVTEGPSLPVGVSSIKYPALSAPKLRDIISTVQWHELDNHNPGFLKALHYMTHQFMPSDPARVLERSWMNMPQDFRPVGERIIAEYKKDLLGIQEFGDVVHLPTAAIAMLWRFKDLPGASIHFFDYGYESGTATVPFMNFQGQISVPVNFGMIKKAAEMMGYKVKLQKDREFIQEMTGEDTLVINRIQGLALDRFGPEIEIMAMMTYFADAAKELCPDADVTESNISGLRVRRSDVEKVAKTLGREYSYKDGSYHFCATNDG